MRHLRLAMIGLLLISDSIYAADLLSVYQTAAESSPVLQSQNATQNIAYAKARGGLGSLLPQIALSGGVSKDQNSVQTNSYKAQLTQTLFNVNTWENWKNLHSFAQSASATYQYQQQQFILNVANAYFSVLQNQDAVSYAYANVKSAYSTFKQTEERFAVGLATMADVKQAQAQYDQARAQLVKNQLGLATAKEQLTAYTGTAFTQLSSLRSDFPYVPPEPNDINHWESLAKRSNWNLESTRLATDAARQAVIADDGSMLPNITLTAVYQRNNYTGSQNAIASVGLLDVTDRYIAVNATWNIFQAPAVSATVASAGPLWSLSAQQEKIYEAQQATEDNTMRNLVASVRQDYLNVMADVRSVAAYKQSVVYNEASLQQAEAQYRVGIQTLTDVLNQMTALYNMKQNYSKQQYKYLADLLQLKLDAGVLSIDDIQQLNNWLVNT